jgi:triphosphatase
VALSNKVVSVNREVRMEVKPRFLANAKPRAAKAKPLALSPGMSVEQAFQAIAANCLTHIQHNAQGVAIAHDVESLHQMRVGMRRLRSALGMFKKLLRLPEVLQHELDWLARELGDARDWDVLSGTTLPALAKGLLEPRHIDGVQQAASDKAREHHVAAAAAVGSPRYARLMFGVTGWVQGMGWHADTALMETAGKQLHRPLKKFSRKILERDHRRLRKRAANLRAATPEARHRVRIAAKKTRYAAEFFASVFSPKTVRPFIKGLTSLQDELGFLNDAAVADRLLTEMAAGAPQLQADASFARGFLAARANNDDKRIAKLWKKFAVVALPR